MTLTSIGEVDVTVVIPTFNRLWCLPRAIESCRGTRCRTQIVVVDDGSTDGTAEWLQKQADIDVLRQENQGQTWAVNRGVQHARGTFVRFLDSDDWLAPETIDRQLARAVESGAEIVCSRVDEWWVPPGIARRGEEPRFDDFTAVQLGEPGQGHYLGMLFHRDLVLAVPRRPDFALRDDRMFLLEVALLEPKIVGLDGCAGFWTKHSQQMHDSYRGLTAPVAIWQYVRIYRQILASLAARGALTDRRRQAAAPVLLALAHQAARFSIDEGRSIAEWAFGLDETLRLRPDVLTTAYRLLGFGATERVLRLRRGILDRFRRADDRRDWYSATAHGADLMGNGIGLP